MKSRKNRPILPGLSRSAACTTTKSCGRLAGHRGDCRPTLSATKSPVATIVEAVVAGTKYRIAIAPDGTLTSLPASGRKARPTKSGTTVAEKGVEVRSSDVYTVQPDRRTKSVATKRVKALCRVSKAGVRCSRTLGHKALGQRHTFTGLVRVIPAATTPDRTQTIRTKHGRTRGYVTSDRPSARLA